MQGDADATGYRRPLPSLGGDPGFSMKDAGASANGGAARSAAAGRALDKGMDRALPGSARRRLFEASLAIKTILCFWVFYFALTTTRAFLLDSPGQIEMMRRRAAVMLAAILLSGLIYLVLRRFRRAGIGAKIAIAAIAALPAAIALAATNHYMFYVFSPLDAVWVSAGEESMRDWSVTKIIVEATYAWYFFFAAWASIYVALTYARQLREADHRAAVLTREAQEAQLRALRYQINPHFLFNTLNSLSSLVLAKRNHIAEKMLMNLSAFFRSTLTADPTADVALAEEIRLQRLYLEIEQVRFPDRLRVEIAVPERLLGRRVPVLILQPVVENSVKYGVARARRPVTIRICAYEEAGRLHLKVKDDGEGVAADEASESTSVGLRNVCDRLASRFGDSAGCIHGADPDGGYTVHIFFPASSGD